MTTPDEMRAMAEQLDIEHLAMERDARQFSSLGVMAKVTTPCSEAAAMLRSIAAEREAEAEAKAQEEYNAGIALEEYGRQAEGSCLYDLYAENRQFASQEPPKRNERGGWDYSV